MLLIHDVDVFAYGAAAIEQRIREVMPGAYPTLLESRELRATTTSRPRRRSAAG